AHKAHWKGGVVWKEDKQKNDWIGVACEDDGASTWLPCKDVTSDECDSAKMRVTIPDTTLFIASNGLFAGAEKRKDSRSFNWKVSYPINTYDITFYVGNFTKIEDSYTGINSKNLQLTYYVLQPHAAIALEHFQQVKEILRTFEEYYGEYPWYKDGFKLVESPYAGMEHQTAIAYGNRFRDDNFFNQDYIILHETGHEWFGNAVTSADFSDIWLQEGFATYGESLFLEKKYGREKADNLFSLYRWFIKNQHPVVGPVGRRYFDYHDNDAYVKGAWILKSLRCTINNDSLFFSVLKTFYNENKYKITDTRSFVECTNKVTGKDFTWFFDAYLNHNETPVLEFEVVHGDLYYRWANVPAEFNKLPVTLRYEFADCEKKYQVYPDNQVRLFSLSESNTPADYAQLVKSPCTCKIDLSHALLGTRKNKHLHIMYDKQTRKK
ncbi:MAG: M1 family aminopeptidase, partial [Bacteroidota bacterium]